MVNILYIKFLNKGKFWWVIGFCCFDFSDFDEELQPQERAIQNQEVKRPNDEHDLVQAGMKTMCYEIAKFIVKRTMVKFDDKEQLQKSTKKGVDPNQEGKRKNMNLSMME